MKESLLALPLFVFLACEVEAPVPLAAPADTIVATVVGTIGPEIHEFGKLSNVALGPNGEVVAVDEYLHQVVVFDETGAFLRSFGGPGDGPGEINEPKGVWVSESGEVAVFSDQYSRLTLYSWDGEPLNVTRRMPTSQGAAWTGVIAEDKTIYERIIALKGPRDRDRVAANQLAKTTPEPDRVVVPERLAQVPLHPGIPISWTMPNGRDNRTLNPLSYNALTSVGPEGTLAALSQDSSSIFVRTPLGETLLEVPMPLPSAFEMATTREVRLAQEYLDDLLADAGYPIPRVPAIRKFPYSMLYLDPHLRLWLTKTPVYQVRMRISAAIADLYSVHGEPLVSVELPLGLRPNRPHLVVNEDKALGIVEDDLGRQTILILKIL